jgi:hypothetical protein
MREMQFSSLCLSALCVTTRGSNTSGGGNNQKALKKKENPSFHLVEYLKELTERRLLKE